MELKLTEEKVKEVAERYGLTAKKVDSEEEAGFIINGKQLNVDELFDILFHNDSTYSHKKLKKEYEHWKEIE